MNIEKAIKYFEDEVRFHENAPAGNPVHKTSDWQQSLEASRMALKALHEYDLAQRNKTEHKETFKEALSTFGETAQIIKLFEELGEFMVAFCKCLGDRDTVEHVADEIADAKIMLDQMATMLDCDKEAEWFGMCKIARLEWRLEEAKKIAAADGKTT